MELFGWSFVKSKETEKKQESIESFTPKQDDDGATLVAAGGHYGSYLDLDGAVKNEAELINKYREMSLQPELELAIDEVVNELVSYSIENTVVDIRMDELKYGDAIKKKIKAEFDNIVQLLDFNNSAYEIVRRWYVDGRLYYHIIIDEPNPKNGIQEIRYVDPRKIKKIREVKKQRSGKIEVLKTQNEFFMYNDRGFASGNKNTANFNPATSGASGVKIATDSIVHVTSGLMDPTNTMVLSYLHKAIKPLNQLRMLEDASVIYRISRAPERRIFYIDVGNLPKLKAEQYMRDMMAKHKNKVVYDSGTGELRDERKFMTMLEDFWLPRRADGKGTEITTLPGGSGLGEMDDILYFQKKLYRALNVPSSRIESDAGFSLGRTSEISREELKFGKFIDRLRMRFSMVFKESLKKQLILKGIMSEEEATDAMNLIRIDFQKDSAFTELKNLEILNNRLDALKNASDFVGRYFSMDTLKKKILQMTEEEIEEEEEKMAAELPAVESPVASEPGELSPEAEDRNT